ncbi:carbohydrate-binding domain-containing protein [Flavivirga eckloniae]|uniref:Carbohydrate-binding protein n=1 Tax=Flavivirga eckloniae TaxID=1803846 RepID=A0A2K9PPH6_9FLAO|nr:carbohydrate-binding domain-containing protein [Flavivirga eckloniae]AUP78946.1 carbohydrate-binding protein [Flavivirga eckloniae]
MENLNIMSFWQALIFVISVPLFSQTVTIDQSVQRYLGTVSDLDRTKYFRIHSNTTSDPEMNTFYSDYNVTRGRGFWGPYSYAKSQTGSVGNYPPYKNGPGGVRNVSSFVSTEHPKNVIRYNLDMVAAANWAVEYWKDFVNDNGRAEFFELMNEPFVHSDDAVFAAQQPDANLMRIRMADWYNEVGKKIHAEPLLANMKVIGYSSAWPSMELWDFGHWNSRMKMFIDRAGANMDGFSTHLYDGINVTGQDSFRSGSNSEAILDLIEAYSHIKFGFVKDHAITEYGGIAKGYGPNYSDTESSQTVKSFNNILFNLLEREDRMAISIPFATDKSLWFLTAANNYQPYGAVLLRPTNLGQPNPAGWVYTPKVYFYDLWKEFKGKRVEVSSNDFDIQAQAFVNGTKMYVAINNLDTASKTVSLNFADAFSGFQNVRIKALKVYDNSPPVFTNTLSTNAPSSITLIGGETVTLEYSFSNSLTFDNAIRRTKYYASTYLKSITSGSNMSFSFNGVSSGSGKAMLRMSIGRKHNVTKAPTVKVNGTTVSVPNNWKGYDQANRTDFFGTIEIPVPINLIQTNNTVTLTFPDSGGRVASLILQVEKYDTMVSGQSPYPNGVAHAIPGTILCKNFDNGGEGVAYHDTSSGNTGGLYRSTDVDLGNGDGDVVIGWTASNEWLEYTTNVVAGTYNISARVSSPQNNKRIVVKLDGTTLGTFTLPNTGAWHTYQTITLNNIALSGGNGKILRLEFPDGGLNLKTLSFVNTTPNADTVNCGLLPTSVASSTSYVVNVSYTATQSRDVVVEFWNSGWLSNGKTTVSAGSGTAAVTVNLNNAPAVGSGYLWKANIRPVGTSWTSNIDGCNITGVNVTSSAKQSNKKEAPVQVNNRVVKAYPNPFKSILKIELPENHQFNKALIFDLYGRTLYEQKISNKQKHVDLSNFGLKATNSNIYIIRLSGKKGTWGTKTIRVIKE